MSLADPQVITVNSVAKSMPKVEYGPRSATYSMADGTFALRISHQAAKKKGSGANRTRSLAAFTQKAVVADPLTAVNDYDTVTAQFTIDRPEFGFTTTQIDQLVTGFKTWLSSGLLAQMLGGES